MQMGKQNYNKTSSFYLFCVYCVDTVIQIPNPNKENLNNARFYPLMCFILSPCLHKVGICKLNYNHYLYIT